jgi:hypothetical protein
VTKAEFDEEHTRLQREFTDLDQEYALLAGDPSWSRQREHARRLLDHIARLQGFIIVMRQIG